MNFNKKNLFLNFMFSSIIFISFLSFLKNSFFGLLSIVFLVIFYFKKFKNLVFNLNKMKFLFMFLSIWLMYFMLQMKKSKIFLMLYLIFLGCFLTKKIFMFFIFFELSLIPTYFLVIRGSTPERFLASKYLILYTFFGSLPLLMSMLMKMNKKSQNFYFFFNYLSGFFYFFMLAFLMKLPMFFFHLWLPKAHVEASTEGSMILAGILLKLGSYGLMIFLLKLDINMYLSKLVIIGGMLAGMFSLLQMDIKSYMAYSSMIHMSYMVLSSFGMLFMGMMGVIFMSVGHGFISAGLFYLLSLAYKFSGSRKILFLKGVFSVYFFSIFFIGGCLMLKSSAPMSFGFLGEVFMFLKGSKMLKFWKFIFILGLNLLGGVLSMFLFLVLNHGGGVKMKINMKILKLSILFFLMIYSVIFFPLVNLFL